MGGTLATTSEQLKSNPPANQQAAWKARRPFAVTLLILGVLILTWVNLNRVILALQQWDFLSALLPFSPFYQVVSGLVWSFAGAALLWGLWRGKSWTPGRFKWVSLAYVVYIWMEKLLLVKNPDKATNLPFSIVFHLLALAFIFWTFSRDIVRAFFGERHD